MSTLAGEVELWKRRSGDAEAEALQKMRDAVVLKDTCFEAVEVAKSLDRKVEDLEAEVVAFKSEVAEADERLKKVVLWWKANSGTKRTGPRCPL